MTAPTEPCPRTQGSATDAILVDFVRADLRRSIEQLHALGWRLTTAGGDTVEQLALIQVGTGRRVPVWSESISAAAPPRATKGGA